MTNQISISIVNTVREGPQVCFRSPRGITKTHAAYMESLLKDYDLWPRYRVRVKNGFMQIGKTYSGKIRNWFTVDGEKNLRLWGRGKRSLKHLRLRDQGLTEIQWKVMEFMDEGFTNEEICKKLGLSLHGLKHHIYGVYQQLEVDDGQANCIRF